MKLFIPLAAVGALLVFSPVAAQSPQAEPASMRVGYGDLDLGSAGGVAELDRRIDTAVRTFCGTASDINLKGKNDVRQCHAEAKQAAARQREQALAANRAGGTRLLASSGDAATARSR
jgi:UrcA family protein